MEKYILVLIIKVTLIFLFAASYSHGQTKLYGLVTDAQYVPLPSANVYLKDTYDGASTDLDGKYVFSSSEKGEGTLVASYVGFQTVEKKISLDGKEHEINFVLQPGAGHIRTVVISAGSFEASDEKKSVILRPLDIVSTASANGDIYGALNTLPGTQQVGETEGLFVRGGDASEAKTIIDEMVVQNPYFSSVPDVPQRGRFSPFLFSGTIFSTGGYSAQYGQALSSALILKTQDLAPETRSSFSIMAAGVGAVHTQRWENTSLSVSANYYNLAPYFQIDKQRTDWDRAPIGENGLVILRHKTSNTGMFKFYSSYTDSRLAMYTDNMEHAGQKDHFSLKNYDIYLNSSYREILGSDWTIFAGTSYSRNRDDINILSDNFISKKELSQAKLSCTKGLFEGSFLTFGAEFQNAVYDNTFDVYNRNVKDLYSAAYVESDLFLSNTLAVRFGLRLENSGFLKKTDLAPRLSVAQQLWEHGQINFAYGQFYQTPDKEFLFTDSKLGFERADHVILNYQYIDDDYTFRVEGYYKDYKNLVKIINPKPFYDENNVYNFQDNLYNNSGKGYAKGIDIFFRDKKTIEGGDYWISYSYLDTKRDYHDFPAMATPTFATPHTISVVYKQYIKFLSTIFGATYTFATGRPYYNPNNPEFMADKTGNYNNFCINGSYLTNILGNFTVVYFSVGNILGSENVFGYRYSRDGQRNSPIVAPSLHSAFIGVFVSLGGDSSVPTL